MKIYKNLINSSAETLKEIFGNKRYADKAIERLFKEHPQWGSRDRRFVAECVYDIVRYKRLYSSLVNSDNNYWLMVAAWVLLKGYDLPDWPEFRHLDRDSIKPLFERLQQEPVIAESYPDWLWEFGIGALGQERWLNEAHALNQPAPLVIRLNTLKGSLQELRARLGDLATAPVPGLPEALVLTKKENLFRHPLFKEGGFEVQDGGSQLIAPFLDPRPGEMIIDACAGAGGKSLHLAALMKNKGRLICLDVEAWKLDELKKRAKRAGAHNMETKVIDDAGIITALSGKADRVLLDVPCSGSGVFRRNPDAKWKLSPEVIERTRNLQRDILERYSLMVKPGGHMVYSTCSIFPSENEVQVKHFLASHSDFDLLKEQQVWPSEGFDGFYMALLHKKT